MRNLLFSRRLAMGAFLTAATLLTACGGGSQSSILPVATPTPMPSAAPTATPPAVQNVSSSTTASVPLPSVATAGITVSGTLPATNVAAAIQVGVSAAAPTGVTAFVKKRLGATGPSLIYLQLSSVVPVTLSSVPALTFTVPAIVPNSSYYLGLSDGNGWQSPFDGPATVNGTTVSFAAEAGTISITPTTPATFVLYTAPAATPTPAPTATPTATPSASPTPTPTATPTPTPTPTPTATPTPTPTPTPTATPPASGTFTTSTTTTATLPTLGVSGATVTGAFPIAGVSAQLSETVSTTSPAGVTGLTINGVPASLYVEFKGTTNVSFGMSPALTITLPSVPAGYTYTLTYGSGQEWDESFTGTANGNTITFPTASASHSLLTSTQPAIFALVVAQPTSGTVTTSTTTTATLPTLGAAGATVNGAFPISSATTQLTETVSSTSPRGVTGLTTNGIAASLYVEFTGASNVSFAMSPALTITLPSVTAGATYTITYGSGQEWDESFPGTANGNTITFPTGSAIGTLITSTQPAIFALVVTPPVP